VVRVRSLLHFGRQRAVIVCATLLSHVDCLVCPHRTDLQPTGHRSATYYWLRQLGRHFVANPESTRLYNFAAYAKAHLPPSQVVVRSLPLHADILARDERSPGARVLPEPDQDATYAPNIVEEVALFNHKYVQDALLPEHKARAVARAATWMARHKARIADSRAGSEVVGSAGVGGGGEK
jgi:hypothetical protein